MAFKYRRRTTEEWDRRLNQSSSDFEGWIKDEYRLYSAPKGENWIRILPPPEDFPHLGMDVWVHFGIGPERSSVICNFKMKDEPCPICQERARAERAKDDDLARDLRPVRRVLVFVINRKDEQAGPLAWGMPLTVDREITKVSRDRSTGTYYAVDDPEQGYDIYFDKEGDGITTKYTGVSLSRRSSEVPPRILDWLEKNPIPEILRWRTYDEVKRIFDGAGRGEAPLDEEESNVRPLRRPAEHPRGTATDEREAADRPERTAERERPYDRPADRTERTEERRRPRSRTDELLDDDTDAGRPAAAMQESAEEPGRADYLEGTDNPGRAGYHEGTEEARRPAAAPAERTVGVERVSRPGGNRAAADQPERTEQNERRMQRPQPAPSGNGAGSGVGNGADRSPGDYKDRAAELRARMMRG